MYTLAVFLPLIGAGIVGFFGRKLGDRPSQILSCAFMVAAAILSILIFKKVAVDGVTTTVTLFQWIQSGDLNVSWALYFDTLTAVMILVVNVISCLIHIYSVGYMAHDHSIPRFMAYLSLFTFFMLMLVTSNNLVQMFFGWEGVGLASYLLIGFWYQKPSANAAAIKAFVVNRVGDFGFVLGIVGVFLVFNSVDFATIFSGAPALADAKMSFLGFEGHTLTILCILLFIGAMGKSAQLGLHTWLPDAMEGPTPVSALIHAATMVTAGVFMVARLSPLFEYAPIALEVVTFVGASTAFFAATVGLTQNDIKRVIAYSTCSQLGYMFFALGVSAYQAGIFHLMTHAFFKALLFLGAGSVIHAMSGEQDMRKMGGIWKHIKITYALMWIGSLALAGIPFFAGYYSKDIILEAVYAAHTPMGKYAFVLGIAAAFLTALYSWRLLFMTFHGKPRADEKVMAHVHESPMVMLLPLMVLALGAIGAGYIAYDAFVGEENQAFWRGALFVLPSHHALHDAHHVATWVKLLPTIVAILGIMVAYRYYLARPDLPGLWAQRLRPLYLFSYHKWYFDELYDRLFVKPAQRLGFNFWRTGDGKIIDGFGPDGVSRATQLFAERASAMQTGYVYHYVFAMIIGLALFLAWFIYQIGYYA